VADEEASERVSMRDHVDNPLIVLLVFAFFTMAAMAITRAVGNKLNAPGITAFGGG
jgi:hypothetical protein